MRSQLREIAMLAWAFICLALAGCDETSKALPDLSGRPFPAFRLNTLQGEAYSEAQLRGSFVLVNFWATWCAPCRREMPSLQRLGEHFPPTRFRVVGVSTDSDLNLAREFLLSNQIRFLNLADPEQKLARDALGLGVFPYNFLLAPDGRVLRAIAGSREWDDEATVEGLRALMAAEGGPN